MTVQLLRQSKTFIVEQRKQMSKGISKRVQHCDYVYVTSLPTNFGFDDAAALIDELERISGAELFNVQLVLDDMTGNWTLRCSSVSSLAAEYTLNI